MRHDKEASDHSTHTIDSARRGASFKQLYRIVYCTPPEFIMIGLSPRWHEQCRRGIVATRGGVSCRDKGPHSIPILFFSLFLIISAPRTESNFSSFFFLAPPKKKKKKWSLSQGISFVYLALLLITRLQNYKVKAIITQQITYLNGSLFIRAPLANSNMVQGRYRTRQDRSSTVLLPCECSALFGSWFQQVALTQLLLVDVMWWYVNSNASFNMLINRGSGRSLSSFCRLVFIVI